MKRLLWMVLGVTMGLSSLGMTTAGPAAAGSTQGAGTHRVLAHVINLHKPYEARLGHTAQSQNTAGTVYVVDQDPSHGRGGTTAPSICVT